MNLEDTKKLVTNVIENEFRHISEYEEYEDFNADIDINSSSQKIDNLLEQLFDLLPENKDLIFELESEFGDRTTAACKYYFEKGVIAGTTNLEFLKNTQIMNIV